MKKKIFITLGIFALSILLYFVYNFSKFAEGVNDDTKRRNDIINNRKDKTFFDNNDTIVK
jgi:hypothetical protein